MAGKQANKHATFVVELIDLNLRAISSRSTIVVTREGAKGERYRAVGRGGAVTRFTFQLPPGSYALSVACSGYAPERRLVTLQAGERRADAVALDWEPLARRGKDRGDDDGEKKLVDGRLREFGAARSQGLGEFPFDGRARALEQKRKMVDPDVTNARLRVEPVANPLANTSLDDIGSWVEVRARNPRRPFERALLKIPYQEKDLGWVDPATLRVYAADVTARRIDLIAHSGADVQRHWAWAYIDRPGIYGVIGLPRDRMVLEVVHALSRTGIEGKGGGAWQERICSLLRDGEANLRPPGGIGGTAFELCGRIVLLAGGLPEGQLLDGRPSGPPPGPPPSGSCAWLSTGPRNINGRITALAVHPGVANRVFAGTANAGVWLTSNAGSSWTPLMSQEGALEIGAVALHMTDPASPAGDVTIYAATGETRAFNGYRGVGVLKSTASGAVGTWMATGAIPTPGGNTFTCLAVDPTTVTAAGTSTVVYAGCPGGLYKSTNAGGLWTQVLNENVQSVVLDPTNPNIIYAGVAFKGVYRYDPATSTWGTFNSGIAGAFPQLIAVDIGQSAPHTLYAKLDQIVYKYDVASSSWQSKGAHGSTTYGYWSNYIAVDPTNSNIVFVGGLAVERTYDGGSSWQTPGVGHEDQHAFAFDSGNHFNVYAGNDGGVYAGSYASLMDTGTWAKRSNGLTISHLNSLGVSSAGPDLVGCGVQDNGTIRTGGGLTWDSLPVGGDGSGFIIDAANPRIVYAQLTTIMGGTYYNSHPYKSVAGGASFTAADTGYLDGGIGPFLGHMVLDPNSPPEPNRVLFIAAAGQVVQRSVNSAGSWTTSSPALGAEVSALAVAPLSSAVVFAGTRSGALWRSSDGGATVANWRNVTAGSGGSATLPPRRVSKIVVHPTDANTVYLGFSGYNGASPGHVYRGTSSDGWAANWTWTDITSNLPDIPVNALEVRRPVASPPTLWAGTDTGVFQTPDGGISWAPFDTGLPNIVVADLALAAAGDVLRAATYGYSMWEIRLDGSCPQMDIYVRDDKLDTGEGSAPSGVPDPTQGSGFVNWWESVDVKTDVFPYHPTPVDGVDFDQFLHQNPVINDVAHPNANKLYVQVHNRGPLPSVNVMVKPLWADASAGLPPLPNDFWSTFPNAWTAPSSWSPVDGAALFRTIPQLAPHTPRILEWDWTIPTTAAQHTCMLVVISADDDNVTRSDATPGDHFVWIVEPNDKHVALRNLTVLGASHPPPPGGGGGVPPAVGAVIALHNPLLNADLVDVLFDPGSLPRATRVSLLLPGGPAPGRLKGPGYVPASAATAKAWWRKASLGGRPWKREAKLSLALAQADGLGRRVSTVPGILVPALGKVEAALVIAPPRTAQPGARYQCAVLQRQAGAIVGGNTFELRIPELEVVVKRPR